MNETQKAAIQQNWVFLLQNMDVDESLLLDHLVEKQILTLQQKEMVTVQSVSKDKVSKLLEILQRKEPTAFQGFLNALEDSNQAHVAQQLRHAFQPTEESPQGPEI